jgi:hypothetical protein
MYFEDHFRLSGVVRSSSLTRPNRSGNFTMRIKLDSISQEVFRQARLWGERTDGDYWLLSSAAKGPVIVTTPDGNLYKRGIRRGSSITVFLVRYPVPIPGPYEWMTFFKSVRLDKLPLPAHQDPANIPTLDERD